MSKVNTDSLNALKPVAHAIKDSVDRIIHVEQMIGNAMLLAHGRKIVPLFAQPAPVLTPAEYAAVREAITFFLSEWSQQKELGYENSTCVMLSALLDRFHVKPTPDYDDLPNDLWD